MQNVWLCSLQGHHSIAEEMPWGVGGVRAVHGGANWGGSYSS